MSIVAWDGRRHDRMVLFGDTKCHSRKLGVLMTALLLGWDCVLSMASFFLNGWRGYEWPAFQKGRSFHHADCRQKQIYAIFMSNHPNYGRESIHGMGVIEAAIGAMAMGADARKAVELASIIYCSGMRDLVSMRLTFEG